ncbi:optic atrophy 3 protein-domain-containing protein [Lyophyllum atratum]|nr:optic atrophy 3 protein-domain-containing protein [Lyophyllum atratum]
MASVKLATLVIRTIAKPISAQLKNQATQHERFRNFCVSLAQMLYRSEVKLRTNIMGEPAKHIRPLSETRAIENGANALAEGFLFTVAAGLILGESWRSSRSQSKQRSDVAEQLDSLDTRVTELASRIDDLAARWEDELKHERYRNDELSRILQRVVDIKLHHDGWADLEGTPLQNLSAPRIQFPPQTHSEDARIDADTQDTDSDSHPPPSSSSTPS